MKKHLVCLALFLLMLLGVSALAEEAAPTIPVVELEGECLNDYRHWNDKSTYYPATLTYTYGDTAFTSEIEIKPQGTSSLQAPKKNFTVKFKEGVQVKDNWGVQRQYVLKADYVDATRSCNVVSAQLAAEMYAQYDMFPDAPNHGVIDGFPVWVKINGEDAGIFNWTIPKAAWLFGMDENNPNHLVLACEGWTPASALMSADIDYEVDWSFEVGEPTDENKATFERMAKFVSTADEATFIRDFDQYLDLDACLNYICFVNTAYATDNISKNMLMVTYDGKVWAPVLYDMDSLWGIGYDGKTLVAADGQWKEKMLTDDNCLLYRVNHSFREQLVERYAELRQGILSKQHIGEAFVAYATRIPQEMRELDAAMWNADGRHIRTLELMSNLMDDYLPVVDGYFTSDANVPAGTETANTPAVRYVLDVQGQLYSYENLDSLPVTVQVNYAIDGQPVSLAEAAGMSGRVEAVLTVQRKTDAPHVYGVTALVHMDEEKYSNIEIIGGNHVTAEHQHQCSGCAWLGGEYNTYEMRLSMDVKDFVPMAYTVVITPVYFDGGDNSLEIMGQIAGELDQAIQQGVPLYDRVVELHKYLTSMQNALLAAQDSVMKMLPAETTDAQAEDAVAIMEKMLLEAQAEMAAMLKDFGCEVPEGVTADELMKLFVEACQAPELTEEEKTAAYALYNRIENYMTVVGELNNTRHFAASAYEYLNQVNTYLPDLAGAYSYANDGLYAVIYRISALYQNLSNYYAAHQGGGIAPVLNGNGYDMIVYTNVQEISGQ